MKHPIHTILASLLLLLSVLHTERISAQTIVSRADNAGLAFTYHSSFSSGAALAHMGRDGTSFQIDGMPTYQARITDAQAIANYGATFRYTFVANTDHYVDIHVLHRVRWEEYGPMATLATGGQYQLQQNPTLCWPRRYAASMILSLDGQNLPTAQTCRPVAPDVYDPAGMEFSALLADSTRWTSTLLNGGVPNDTLWLWPASVESDAMPASDSHIHYRGIHLTRGAHVLTVTSLCGLWDFDALKLVPSTPDTIIPTHVEHDRSDTRVFNLCGQQVCLKGERTLDPGLYIVGGLKMLVR